MLVSYNWLKDYVDLDGVQPNDLADRITKSGIEVEGVESLNDGISGVVVGHVETCEQHPNADKLNVCSVNIGEEEPVQIICGASNVAAGQKVAVAKVGAVLPGNFKIKKAKLRGEASHGMICSLEELGVDSKMVPKEFADGIYVLAEDAEVGVDALSLLNLDDHILELGLTPNRADCLNMMGVAYEVSAVLNKELNLAKPSIKEVSDSANDYITVKIDDQEDNPYYGARIIRNIKVGPSPEWMQSRLIAAGIRPINNVVDITNYVLIEYGQPLHAFDYDRFGSKEVVIRRASSGEEIVTLDDETRKLEADHLVITNGSVPVAVAGVMGGADSEVTDQTTTVLLESAYFNPSIVRQASKDLGLRSESSTRFEKGIDRNRVFEAASRAAQLLEEIAGGEVLEGIVEDGPRHVDCYKVSVSASRANKVLGTSINNDAIIEIFNRLGFSYEVEGDVFHVEIPTRRPDITLEEDLIEEIGRIYGYDLIPATLPVGSTTPGELNSAQKKRRLVRRYLEGAGLYQAITYSLTTKSKANQYSGKETNGKLEYVSVSMPMSEERAVLRRTILPQLIEVVQYNQNRQMNDVAIFEVGSTYVTEQTELKELPTEHQKLAGAFSGLWRSHPWQQEKKQVDFYVVKGILDGLFAKLGLSDRVEYQQAKREGFHPGRTAILLLDGKQIGVVGQLHPADQKDWDVKETYLFELDLDELFHADVPPVIYNALPRYPSITRDIALILDQDVQAGDVQTGIKAAGGELLKHVSIFDLYEGEHMDEGKKSVAYSLTYYNPEKTLTDEDVEKVHHKVIEHVKDQFNATMRG
ncbi:phenylalanine--tRNA ligase subunit beta [Pseudalkalibacillus berkeleyi]|uniref:Phenylalanine--tRNA ligase beta subunit n=1 Tax=Pseudalkalibacillus berkeleyi TaxID=1069813 RepID=A0ABS9H2M0_9BACL|nr:phenylalanine--tRNA ligase subunit beta [Pseudalkalibacillus berkeleyi]MCF6138171.1 phenylalanine--tRNA ligase subunit beta [Pseudalkalibacillus berkeleyi]